MVDLLLESARRERTPVRVVALMLRTVGGEKRMVTHYADHGDGDGHERVAELQDEMRPFLQAGEWLFLEDHVIQY